MLKLTFIIKFAFLKIISYLTRAMKNFPISIKHLAVPALAALCAAGISAADSPATDPSDSYGVYVDNHGRMRRDDNRQEVRYYGTNYTLPFAHAYRAVGAQGIDRKDAIDRDTYHIARMGANAFRLHLWDVELSDSVGNLLNNDHLDLLDYLISQMERRGIRVILTAQTNFGNGYPEHNVDTGAYSYRYEKCKVHEAPGAIAAQRRYPTFLARTYTFPLAHTLNPSDIEKVQLTVTALPSASPTTTLLEGIWLQ